MKLTKSQLKEMIAEAVKEQLSEQAIKSKEQRQLYYLLNEKGGIGEASYMARTSARKALKAHRDISEQEPKLGSELMEYIKLANLLDEQAERVVKLLNELGIPTR